MNPYRHLSLPPPRGLLLKWLWDQLLMRILAPLLWIADRRTRVVAAFWGVVSGVSLQLMVTGHFHGNIMLSVGALFVAMLCIPLAEIGRRLGLEWDGQTWLLTAVAAQLATVLWAVGCWAIR